MRMVQTEVPRMVKYRGPYLAAFEVTEPNRDLGESRITFFQEVMDWCYEQFGNGQSLVNFQAQPRPETTWIYSAATLIIIDNPDNAFAFKMRWC